MAFCQCRRITLRPRGLIPYNRLLDSNGPSTASLGIPCGTRTTFRVPYLISFIPPIRVVQLQGQTIRSGGTNGASYKRICIGSGTPHVLNGLPMLSGEANGGSCKRSCIGFGTPRVLNSRTLIDPDDLKRVRSGYAKERLGDRLLAEAQVALDHSVALINPHDLEIIKEMLLFAEDMRIKLNTKRGFSRIQQALEYSRIAKDVFELVKAFLKRADDIDRRMVGSINPDLAHELSCVNVVPTLLTTHFVTYPTQRNIPNAPSSTQLSLPQRPSGCSSPLNTTTVLPSRASTFVSAFSRIQRDFFTSAYSDYGAVTSPLQAFNEIASASSSQPGSPYSYVSPTLLYGPSSITPTNTSFSSPFSSPVGTQGQTQGSYHPLSTQVSSSASSHLSKSFHCPKPNHNKSYTHMNALNYYHMAHRHCNSTTEEFEAAQAHFVENGVVVNGSGHSRVPITEGELCELKREIECRRHPFSCGADDSQWRCRSREGRRSHYQHSKSAVAACQSTVVPGATKTLSSPLPREPASPLWHYPQGFGQFRNSSSDVVNSHPSPTREYAPASPPNPPGRLLSNHVRELSTDGPQCVNVINTPTSSARRHVPPSRPTLPPSNNFASDPMHDQLTNNQQWTTAVSTPPSSAQEHIPVSPSGPPDKPLSDHVGELFSDNLQCVNATSTQSSSTQKHVPISQSSRSRIPTPPDKLHPTLSCWIKNMNKLSSLVDHLQELASSAPAEHRSRLLNQIVVLRTTLKRQKEHLMELLELSEEYAHRYLLDISAEIQQQSSFLDKLNERLEAAKKLLGEAAELKTLYESGTVAIMKELRVKALSRPLPEDRALFNEVDSVLTEIKHWYTELENFLTEEISRAIEALKIRCVDPTDFERWKNFHANLKQTVESWKNESSKPSGDSQTLHRSNSREEADIGAIASSLSSAVGLLTSALDRLPLSNSSKYSQSSRSSIQRVYVAFAANSDLCLSFLRRCADYGEKVFDLYHPSTALPTSFHVGDSHDLREQTVRLISETKGVSARNAVSVQGSRKFKAAYNKALRLEQKTTSGLNTLLEELSSWVTVTDGHGLPDDPLPVTISLEELRDLWENAGYTVREALTTLSNEPAPQLSTRPLTVIKRWLMNLVCYS